MAPEGPVSSFGRGASLHRGRSAPLATPAGGAGFQGVRYLISLESHMTSDPDTNGFNNNLFERTQEMNRSWLKRLQEIRQIDSDFGARLLAAHSPAEATDICNEWMRKHLEIVASEQRSFTTAWLGLISNVMASRSSTTFAPDRPPTP